MHAKMICTAFRCLPAFVTAMAVAGPVAAQRWQPAQSPLSTQWTREVSPENAHRQYPRPQMVRPEWLNLNGLWSFAVQATEQEVPDQWEGEILVPFAIESALSGVGRKVTPQQTLWYRRTFSVPNAWAGKRVVLNFEAVDWEATVWVNGRQVGRHEGGYDPFAMDITDALHGEGPQEITVRVWDPTDTGYQPRGKQVREPHSIWYTSVTGIWQTVWLEAVDRQHIQSLRMTPDADKGEIEIVAETSQPADGSQLEVTITGLHQGELTETVPQYNSTPEASDENSVRAVVRLPEPQLWSPQSPWLYDVKLQLVDSEGQVTDQVDSYFGLRKIEVKKDDGGVNRLWLNNQVLFQFGPLDQGWWPDGLYTAPTDEALRYDLEVTKRLGYNMCRKHVKVEPRRWYHHCDRLGMLVWQDMPSGDRYIGGNDPDIERVAQSERTFRREYQALIDAHFNHPSIVVWVPFNEGWGQFATNQILAWTKQLDPTRLVDGPSGWADRATGDMHDMHRYPGPAMPAVEDERAAVLGEFGGLGWPVEGHLWQQKDNWGYRTYSNQQELVDAYTKLIEQLPPLIRQGLAAAVYTQTTDVEIEVNGVMTYDRQVIKLPETAVLLHGQLYQQGTEDEGN